MEVHEAQEIAQEREAVMGVLAGVMVTAVLLLLSQTIYL